MFSSNRFLLARRLLGLYAVVAVLLIASVCILMQPAMADADGVNVTSNVQGFFDLAITVLVAAVVAVVKIEFPRLTGATLSGNNLAVLQGFLSQVAHTWVNTHLLKPGAEITVNTKSVLGNQLLQDAQTALPKEIASLGLSNNALASMAVGAVAQALNALPNAPPFAAAAPAIPAAS